MNPEFSSYLNTSVDDLRSTLGCELQHTQPGEAAARIEFFTAMAGGCSQQSSRRKLIETHIRKLEKLSSATKKGAIEAAANVIHAELEPEPAPAPNYLAVLTIFAAKRGDMPYVKFTQDNADFIEARASLQVAWVHVLYACNEQDAESRAANAWQAGIGGITQAGMQAGITLPHSAAPSGPEGHNSDATTITQGVTAPSQSPKGVRTVTLNDLSVMPAAPAPSDDEWANARRYAEMAEGGTQVVIVAQIMCGFELIELQKRVGMTRGAKGRKGNKPHDVVYSWADLVQQKIGRSDETARRWMNMAKTVAPRLKKLEGPWEAPALLALPPSEWPEGAREAVSKTLKNVCDGETQAQWMEELGLIKRGDGRANNPGGYRPHLEYLRPWLQEEYPEQPELLEMLFDDLPKEIQQRFRKEGERYMNRLPKERKEEIAREATGIEWMGSASQSLNEALDAQLYHFGTVEQLTQLEASLSDLLTSVRKHIRERAEKSRSSLPVQ